MIGIILVWIFLGYLAYYTNEPIYSVFEFEHFIALLIKMVLAILLGPISFIFYYLNK